MTRLKRVIVDTNVVVSAAKARGRTDAIRFSASIVRKWEQGSFKGVMGDSLLEEYREVLHRPQVRVAIPKRDNVLALATDPARTEHHATEAPPYQRVSKDPGDDHLFALVRAAAPDFLCSQDVPGLLDMHLYQDTLIIAPGLLFELIHLSELEVGSVPGSERAPPRKGS